MEEPPQLAWTQATTPSVAIRTWLVRRIPTTPTSRTSMLDVIGIAVVDDGDFMQVHEHYARNVMCWAFARFDGRPVGIVAQSARPPRWCAGHRCIQ